jgi:hypothetical protein
MGVMVEVRIFHLLMDNLAGAWVGVEFKYFLKVDLQMVLVVLLCPVKVTTVATGIEI